MTGGNFVWKRERQSEQESKTLLIWSITKINTVAEITQQQQVAACNMYLWETMLKYNWPERQNANIKHVWLVSVASLRNSGGQPSLSGVETRPCQMLSDNLTVKFLLNLTWISPVCSHTLALSNACSVPKFKATSYCFHWGVNQHDKYVVKDCNIALRDFLSKSLADNGFCKYYHFFFFSFFALVPLVFSSICFMRECLK